MFSKSHYLVISLALVVGRALGQTPDTPQYSVQAKQVIADYLSSVDGHSELFSGISYHLYPPARKGSPYFLSTSTFTPALVFFEGTWYKNVPVIYDIFSDAMVSVANDSLFVLRAEKIRDVYLSDHHLIYLDLARAKNLEPGFYEQLYGGSSQVLVKRRRTVQKMVSQQMVEVIYENKDVIYIKKADRFAAVNSKTSVLEIFSGKAKLIKQYMDNSKLPYQKEKEQSIVKLAGYYDQLTN